MGPVYQTVRQSRGIMVLKLLHLPVWAYGVAYLASIPVFALAYYLNPCMVNISEPTVIDGLYFSAVTITTLGFGDYLPVTDTGKVIVGFQAVFGVCLIGLFLNAVSELKAKLVREMEVSENRNILQMHICLLLEALESGNPFIWDKHVKHAKPIEELIDFSKKVHLGVLNDSMKLGPLQIKAFLETSDQVYDTMVALIPVSSNVSGAVAFKWVSIVSNIKNVRGQYLKSIENSTETEVVEWPKQGEIALQIQEFIATSFQLCGLPEPPKK